MSGIPRHSEGIGQTPMRYYMFLGGKIQCYAYILKAAASSQCSSINGFFNHEQREPVMSKYTYSTADVLPEGRVPDESLELMMNFAESGHSSAPSGIFSLRRARYLNKTGFDETGHGVRRADIAEAAIAAVIEELQQAARDHRDPALGRKSDTGAGKEIRATNGIFFSGSTLTGRPS
jgi:hypothetical protein